MVGVFHDPGQGGRYVDCGFVSLNIADYSFERETPNRTLEPLLDDGDRVEFEATLGFYQGAKIPLDGAPPVQERSPPITTIGGIQYKVYPPSYHITNAIILSRR